MKLLSKGITPEVPPLFDANALLKIYSKKGIEFKEMQKEMPEIKWQLVKCVRCNEMSIVSEYVNCS